MKRKSLYLQPPTAEELGLIPRRSLSMRILRTVSLIVTLCLVFGFAWGYVWVRDLGVFDLKTEQLVPVLVRNQMDNALVYDRNGQKIGEFFERYQIYIPFAQLPKTLVNAIIAIEDRSFFSHQGIDLKAILRASLQTLVDGGLSQGASTITQQLVRNVFLTKEKSAARKVKELVISLRIDGDLSKETIFELYANTLFLGYGSYGVGAAAKRFFGRELSQLEGHELAVLAGLFQSPSNYNPHRFPERAKQRQVQVIQAMYAAKLITKAEALDWMKKPLVYTDYEPLNEQLAPHFIDYVREQVDQLLEKRVENSGIRVFTTLDAQLQRFANGTFLAQDLMLNELEKKIRPDRRRSKDKPRLEAALVSIDPRSGEMLAMVGGRDYRSSKYNRTWQSLRSPGSAFKPVVYTAALEQGASWFDVKLVGPVSVDGYRPKNYKEEFLSESTLLRAFYLSLNTPAVELAAQVGLDKLVETAARLGVRTPVKVEAGTALGSSSVTMMDVARIYATLANGGQQVDPVAILKITDFSGKILYEAPSLALRSRPAVQPQIAYLMVEGLRSVLQRGTAVSASDLSGVAVGKTGTSNDSIDNWFAGTTPDLTTVVWVGNDLQLAIEGNTTGGSAALPIWAQYQRLVTKIRPSQGFARPGGISSAFLHSKYGSRTSDGVRMYYLSKVRPEISHSEFQAIEEEGTSRSLFNH